MVFKISTRDKQDFLKWFIDTYEFESHENKWILELLLKQPEILEQVEFVKSVNECPRSIIMSTICSPKTEFVYRKNKLVTIDQDKAYHDLRLNFNVPVYLQLNYRGQEKCPNYGFISIDNPYENNHFNRGKDKYLVNKKLNAIALNKTIELIKEKINQSIDNNNKKDFYLYSKKLKKIESQVKNQTLI
ncbi:MAG TPA: YpiB family protein [Pseudogracilibacillus sp.]|nr:YpiB family protein [Pseudogracilibacillus sp.]